MTDREFWEKCGFTLTTRGLLYGDALFIEEDGHTATKMPPITLDNLFKWAVPLVEKKIFLFELFDKWMDMLDESDDDYTQALKKAIEEVL